MNVKAFIKSTTQKHSALIKDSELFNGNHLKWKQFKQPVNADHYSDYNDKINYIDFYLNDKVSCVLNYK